MTIQCAAVKTIEVDMRLPPQKTRYFFPELFSTVIKSPAYNELLIVPN